MLQRAWLSTTPTKHKQSRYERVKSESSLGADDPALALPELGVFSHIVDYLFEAGPTTGDSSLAWAELDRWAFRTGVDLDEFEAVSMVSLSREYLGMVQEARDPNCPPPSAPPATAASKADVQKRLREALRRPRGKKK